MSKTKEFFIPDTSTSIAIIRKILDVEPTREVIRKTIESKEDTEMKVDSCLEMLAIAEVKAGNKGYLARMLDKSHVSALQISIGGSHSNILDTYNFILRYFDVHGEIRSVNLANAPTNVRRGETRRRTTHYLVIENPDDILKLCKLVLPFSERPDKIQRVITQITRLYPRKETGVFEVTKSNEASTAASQESPDRENKSK